MAKLSDEHRAAKDAAERQRARAANSHTGTPQV
jgi:hypothetical protein